jgi:hypothetical protein
MGIIRKPQRERMKEYVVGLLEDARYPIVSASQYEIVFGSKIPERKDDRAHLYLVSNKVKTAKDFSHDFHMALRNRDFAATLYYKDGENFHVLLGGRAKVQRSLDRYSEADKNMMVELNAWEKFGLSAVSPRKLLVYYQPETARLNEGLRAYQMDDVVLDHSYLEEDNWKRNFARGGISVEWKIARELAQQGTHIKFAPLEKGLNTLTVIPPRN